MISKLFPRILNKSSDKTAVKPSEFSDALNILVTGDDGGDSNIIKKADGNIESAINDPENFPILGNTGVIKEEVLGKYEDQERNRVYYFTFGEEDGSSGISYSSIYLLERIDELSYKFILLLRTNSNDDPSVHLGFTREDFVPANIIQTPKLKRESYTDNLNDGSTGDIDTDFDLDEGGDGTPTVAISLLGETLYVAGAPGGDFGEVFDDSDLSTPLTTQYGNFIIQNTGTTSAEVVLSAQVTNSINGASVVIPSTVTVAPNFQLAVYFDIVLDVAQWQNGGGTLGPDGVNVQVSISIDEVVTSDALSLTNYSEVFSSEVTFMFPQPILPLSLNVTSPQTSQAVNFPSSSATGTLIDESFFWPDGIGLYTEFSQFPDNQFASLIGPFQISFDEWEESPQGSPVDLYTGMRVEVSLTAGQENEQGQADFWELVDVNNLSVINNTTSATGNIELEYFFDGGVLFQADATAPFASFYVRKAFDTSTWLADPDLDQAVFSKLRLRISRQTSSGSYTSHPVTSPSFSTAFNAGVITSVNAQINHEIGFLGNIVDAPNPANIQVTNVSWGNNPASFSLDPNVDDGTPANQGSAQTATITVANLGDEGGWFFPTCFWDEKSWDVVGPAGSLTDAQAEDYFGYSAWDVFRGAYELTEITYNGPGQSFQVKPWHPDILGSQNPSWVYSSNQSGVFAPDSFPSSPPSPVFLDGGETGSINILWFNTDPEFRYGAVGASDFSEQEDDEITNTYVGTNGEYYYWGQPDTNTGVTSNFYPDGLPNFAVQLWDVYAKNDPATPTSIDDFFPVWGSSVNSSNGSAYILVDGNFEGSLSIVAHKTFKWDPTISNSQNAFGLHPLFTNTAMGNVISNTPNAEIQWPASNYAGQRPYFVGVYPDNEPIGGTQGSFNAYSSANNSGAGVNGNAQTPEFWFKTDNSWNDQKADFLFINTTTSPLPSDVSLEVFLENYETWFYSDGTNNVSPALPQGVSITGEFSLDVPTQNVHQPTNLIGGMSGTFNTNLNGLGSLGPSVIFSNPIPIPWWAGDSDAVQIPGGGTFNAWTTKSDGSTSYNFPQFDQGLVSPNLNFPLYLNGFRYNQISIPPNHLVVARVQFNWQNKGSQNPQLGMEDIANSTGVDFTDPINVYGMPFILRAKWSGGVTNQESNYVTIGNVLGVANQQQLNALINY